MDDRTIHREALDPSRTPLIANFDSLQHELYILQKETIEIKYQIIHLQDQLSKAKVFLKDYQHDRRKNEVAKTKEAIRVGKEKLLMLKQQKEYNEDRILAIKLILRGRKNEQRREPEDSGTS
jgi:hypothetical protein